ncbi:MAG: amidohydrolase [Actinomycetota bacterium]|nr:amidohydrolase [Actinomycetota bacterium]
MRTVFFNGPIWTGTAATPAWVAIEGSRIAALGEGQPPDGERFDLDGRCLLPGFQDAHVHPPIGGLALIRCELHEVPPSDYAETIANYAADNPDVPWILGGGWPMNAFDGGIARREFLDGIVPDRPVRLNSSEGHASWVNTKALEIAGIGATTPDPQDGRIERDLDGSPNGTLQEGAMGLVDRFAPADTVADVLHAIVAAQDYLVSLGITGWQDAWVRGVDHDAYRTLDADGRLIARVFGSLWWDRERGVEQLDELIATTKEGTPKYRPNGIKLMVDGVIENGTGAVCSPYVGTDDRGLTFIDAEALRTIVPRIMAAGIQPHFHAIGDCAIRSALDAVEAGNPSDVATVRPHIAHIHLIDPVDVPRFSSLGVSANAQALWACHDDTMVDLTIPRLGDERSQWQYPFRSLVDAGAHLAAGSDWSVSTADPFAQMAVAVTRATADAPQPFLPDQALTPSEALTAFTAGSAWVNHDDRRAGTIEAGKDADFVIASDNPITAPDLSRVRAEATFIGGRVMYQR